jgi:hypothetical protein
MVAKTTMITMSSWSATFTQRALVVQTALEQ